MKKARKKKIFTYNKLILHNNVIPVFTCAVSFGNNISPDRWRVACPTFSGCDKQLPSRPLLHHCHDMTSRFAGKIHLQTFLLTSAVSTNIYMGGNAPQNMLVDRIRIQRPPSLIQLVEGLKTIRSHDKWAER